MGKANEAREAFEEWSARVMIIRHKGLHATSHERKRGTHATDPQRTRDVQARQTYSGRGTYISSPDASIPTDTSHPFHA